MLSFVLVCWLFARQVIRLVRQLPRGASRGSTDDVTFCAENDAKREATNTENTECDFNRESNWYATHRKHLVYTTSENIEEEEDGDGGWLGDHNDELYKTQTHYFTLPVCAESELIGGLKQRWLHENRETIDDIRVEVRTALQSSPDPYDFILVFVRRTFNGAKQLSRVALLELQSWSKMSPKNHQRLTSSHKETAVFIGIDCPPKLFELMRNVFELLDGDRSVYESCVRRAIQLGKLKEAATCVAILQMQSHFSVQEILLPLVLIDKPAVLERYLEGQRNVQTLFLQMLDDLSSSSTNLQEVCRSVQVPNTKVTKKQLQKMTSRMAQLYGITLAQCPNLLMSKNEKLLRGFLYSKYVQKKAGNWDELMEGCVRDSPDLQLKLVRELFQHHDIQAAARVAHKFQLATCQLPRAVQTELWRYSNSDAWQCREVEPTGGSLLKTVDFYQLPLPFSSIHLVDNVCGFESCMAAVLKPNNVVGVDSEWRPAVGKTGQMELGLLQLATKTDVFLLDMAVLPQLVPDEMFMTFAERFFSSDEVLTLGYAIAGDLEVLASACPCMHDSLTRPQRVIDLLSFSQTLDQLEAAATEATEVSSIDEQIQPNHTENVGTTVRGLSKLILKYLGKPLDKSNQISDWGMRPLRHDQIVYAALDAYCLLNVYEVMKKQAIRLADMLRVEIDVEPELPRMKWVQPKRANTLHVSPPKSINNPPARLGRPLAPTQFHVVVDSMLYGLGRQLQCCGVNVRMLTHSENHLQAAKISRVENRIILTSGAPFCALRLQVAVGSCYCVVSRKARDQVVEVLRHFNVRVTEKDIFSRCQVCNSDVHVRVAAKDIARLLTLHHTHNLNKATDMQHNQTEPNSSHHRRDLFPGEKISTIQLGHGLTVRDGAAFIDATGTRMLLDTIPISMTGNIRWFFCCMKCGKVFWQGKHFEQIREQFSHVLL